MPIIPTADSSLFRQIDSAVPIHLGDIQQPSEPVVVCVRPRYSLSIELFTRLMVSHQTRRVVRQSHSIGLVDRDSRLRTISCSDGWTFYCYCFFTMYQKDTTLVAWSFPFCPMNRYAGIFMKGVRCEEYSGTMSHPGCEYARDSGDGCFIIFVNKAVTVIRPPDALLLRTSSLQRLATPNNQQQT